VSPTAAVVSKDAYAGSTQFATNFGWNAVAELRHSLEVVAVSMPLGSFMNKRQVGQDIIWVVVASR
jgi:hypothetical protein